MVVLLHDVNRRIEQRIVQRIFSPTDGSIQSLGVVDGSWGSLAGFRIKKPVIPQM